LTEGIVALVQTQDGSEVATPPLPPPPSPPPPPPPHGASKWTKAKKNSLFEAAPKNFGIGVSVAFRLMVLRSSATEVQFRTGATRFEPQNKPEVQFRFWIWPNQNCRFGLRFSQAQIL